MELIAVGLIVFAVQVIAYNVVSKRIATRAAYKRRVATIRSLEHVPRPSAARNKVGEN